MLEEKSHEVSVVRDSARKSALPKKKRYALRGSTLGIIIIHLLPLVSICTGGVGLKEMIFLAVFYVVGMLFAVIGYHRYFSHRSFRTNRFFQFILAFCAQATAQGGALWWASTHRLHHKFSDQKKDIHSPLQKGLWYAHIGWFFSNEHHETKLEVIKDFAKFPELVWLNRHSALPVVCMGLLYFVFLGLPGLFFSFFLGIVILWHGTFTINSLAHVWGKRRYKTDDTSRNNWFLAIITMGEGWHNNHHHYRHSARQGFFWYEFDVAYYVLKFLSLFRIVSDVKGVPIAKRSGNLA